MAIRLNPLYWLARTFIAMDRGLGRVVQYIDDVKFEVEEKRHQKRLRRLEK